MSDSGTEMAASHGSVSGYLMGFVLAVVLTVIPFAAVMSHALSKGSLVVLIVSTAVVQVLVHLKYFLHLDFSYSSRENTFTFLFTALVILLVVGLSVWIIYSANHMMMG
ncbi:cytochrome o ubiquinol oxidase subunit IV [Halioxenophilus aromaticivorans]|uniref:Cytochrome bo(3) ubiquinol oxidase subunit 4 n=1 Tax=Halioxenophilus aromaticivorans TaxID=1306992 RepID=A0AAV3U4Q3_9ALTE